MPRPVAEFIAVVLSEIPMNYESQATVFERAKDLVRRRSHGKGEGAQLSNESHEITSRLVAGVCRYYMSVPECESMMDEVFREAQRIKADRDANESTADYLEWLKVAAAAQRE